MRRRRSVRLRRSPRAAVRPIGSATMEERRGRSPNPLVSSMEGMPRRPMAEAARLLGHAKPPGNQSRRPCREMRHRGTRPTSCKLSRAAGLMSALPPKADIADRDRHVRFVPKADSCTATKRPLAGLRFPCVRPHKPAALQALGQAGASAFHVLLDIHSITSSAVEAQTGHRAGSK
jgi:hypothetical protein